MTTPDDAVAANVDLVMVLCREARRVDRVREAFSGNRWNTCHGRHCAGIANPTWTYRFCTTCYHFICHGCASTHVCGETF